MSKTTKKEASVSIEVMEIERGSVRYCLLGSTPMIPRAMSAKTKHELLLPAGRKTVAEKKTTFKHDVYEEFRSSAIRLREPSDTLLAMPGAAFKKSLGTAALDTPGGGSKAQLLRLTWVEEYNVGIYGLPFLLMSVVRSADMNKTPDIRTRVVIPQWAATITVSYQKPMLTERVISMLLGGAGNTCGVGDWRQEKGSGSFGLWDLVSEDNKAFQSILRSGGRAAQEIAMKDAVPFDEETDSLLRFFNEEKARRTDPKKEKK